MENLWSHIEQLSSTDERMDVILADIKNSTFIYKELANENPQRLFELVGGDVSNVDVTHRWATEYSYDSYIDDYELEFNELEANAWNIEEKSIERAEEMGEYYCTGRVSIYNKSLDELEFDFEFCDGYLDGIIATPYDFAIKEPDYGILM
jgi:hypothetical protein